MLPSSFYLRCFPSNQWENQIVRVRTMLDDKQEKTSISITTNLADKQRATEFLTLGLNLSTAINIFLKKSNVRVVCHLKLKIHFIVKPIKLNLIVVSKRLVKVRTFILTNFQMINKRASSIFK